MPNECQWRSWPWPHIATSRDVCHVSKRFFGDWNWTRYFAAVHANTDTLSRDEKNGNDDWFHITVLNRESEHTT